MHKGGAPKGAPLGVLHWSVDDYMAPPTIGARGWSDAAEPK